MFFAVNTKRRIRLCSSDGFSVQRHRRDLCIYYKIFLTIFANVRFSFKINFVRTNYFDPSS